MAIALLRALLRIVRSPVQAIENDRISGYNKTVSIQRLSFPLILFEWIKVDK